MAKIVVIGSYFSDLVFYCKNFPKTGQTVPGRFAQSHGGKGSNQAVACQKLSKTKAVHFFTALGDDAMARQAE